MKHSNGAAVEDTKTASVHEPELKHHFDDMGQQHEAATLGMWLFLATEVLFFGGLFMAYMLYRVWYPSTFGDASRTLDITLGTVNTMVLIGSSLTMALAVHAAATNERRSSMLFLVLTMALGAVFLGIKAVEYYEKFVEHHVPGAGLPLRGPGAGARAVVLLALLRDDRPARAAHDHRLRHPLGDSLHDLARRLLGPLAHAGGDLPGCTGTSWTSSGSSCFRCSTSWIDTSRDGMTIADRRMVSDE